MRIYKGEGSVNVPSNLNLTELLHQSARNPDPPATEVISKDDLENRTLTIAQLRDTAGCLAHGLAKTYQPKDQSRWAIILPNSIAYVEACHAILWLGGAFCPINHQLKPTEIGHALAVCKPGFVVGYAPLIDQVVEAINAAKELTPEWPYPKIITAAGEHSRYPFLHGTFISPDHLAIPLYPDTRTRLASVHLSSGTTGKSKGVGLSHYNYIANVLQMWAHDPDHWSPDERIVSFTPFVHMANTTKPLFLGPWAGMQHIILAKFDLDACLRLVEENKATAMQVTPTIAVTIANTELASR